MVHIKNRLSEGFLETLKMHNDIVSVMSSYVTMKPAGRDYVCSCPFHSEKTPSCHIYTGTQSFHCFGCQTGGDVITVIRLIEHLGYMDAVRLLAQRAGIAVPEDDESENNYAKKVRIYEMNRAAARYFRDMLLAPEGKEGLDYVISRGLSPNTVRKYGIGFAPPGWHNLHYHLRSKGFTDDEMEMGALITRNNNSLYDKFRNRVIFPIISKEKNVIGFGGRAIDPNDKAKYINTDETIAFKKRENLFSFNFAKNTNENFLIVCEGYMDVISLNQAGFDNAVASLGTALTANQVNLMKNLSSIKDVVLCYDSDNAGQAATSKAINLLSAVGLQGKVLHIPDAKDPDEYIKKFGADSFRHLISKTDKMFEYEFEKLKKGVDLTSISGKIEFVKKAVDFISKINNDIDRSCLISETAKCSNQSVSSIEKLVSNKMNIIKKQEKKALDKKVVNGAVKRDPINPDSLKYPVEEKAERGIIAFLFHSPDRLSDIEQQLNPEDFPTEFNRRVYCCIREYIKNSESLSISSIGGEFTAEEVGRITDICIQGDMLPYSLPRLNEYIRTLVDFKENNSRKPVGEMSDEELLALIEEDKLKRAKKRP
ncbi:MAG: DNA primase [Ruminiclostridium sp.]|nr:DNA primase [Ruminiclostridium sp.]